MKKDSQKSDDYEQLKKELLESQEKYRIITEYMADIITIMDLGWKFVYVSPSVLRLRGFTVEEAMAQTVEEVVAPESLATLLAIFEEELKLEAAGADPLRHRIEEVEHYRKDGSSIWMELSLSFVRDKNQKPTAIIIVSRDIDDRRRAEEALRKSEERYRELSTVDDLTQLYNSRCFHDQFKMEANRVNRYGQPLALLMADIDNFKSFNDAYGHVEGDEVLSRFGQVVKRCLRQTDSAYRYGGEEFTVLLPMTTSKDGFILAERIRKELKKEIFSPLSDQEIHVTVSIGLGQYQPHEDMKIFVQRVDDLMYQAKKNGRDRVCSETKCE